METPLESVDHGPDPAVLTDKVPEHLRAPRVLAGMTLVLGLVYAVCCSRPIWHTDVWGHLSYGRYIWETGSIPATEPLLPLAKGMPFVDTAWLSQLIGYAAVSSQRLHLAGLQGLYALAITGCAGLLAWRSYRQTRNGWFSLMSVGTFLFVASIPLTVLRPQLAGLCCFVFLLTRLAGRTLNRSDWLVIPVVFALWANLHASFIVGLGLMLMFCVGRAADVLRHTGSIRTALKDARVQRLFLLTELAAVAVLVNPYTLELYVETFRFSGNENLQDLTEWHPLTLRDGQGQMFAVVALLLTLVYRLSPRRVRLWEPLALIVLGVATLWSNRMMVWWAPVAALLLAQHAFATWRAWQHAPLVPPAPPTAGKWSFVSLGLVWIFFMISPFGVAIIHGKHIDPSRSLSKFTPRFAAEVLTKRPPEGLVFNTYEWGDYLQWAGPRSMQLFVNSHAHLVPRDVWLAYMQVIELRSGWEETLDRYGINTVVVDLENREPLVKKLKEDERWQFPPEEQDGQVIFRRKKPIRSSVAILPAEPTAPADAGMASQPDAH
ncbi:hypothetical protein [Schlesneria paludicola]|uniref:hypothetical protein n=1 Tax=Schlesneria paludicola TaxID=360056 RepID=UPI00029A8CD2|nr:hypothetical protein [Schlesneria paludicola]